MKVIDLLNKIAKGEEVPKKINIVTNLDINTNYIYIEEEENYRSEIYSNVWLLNHINSYMLNQEIEVEIIDDKKIEKLVFEKIESKEVYEIKEKINELIDEVNKLKGGK